MTFVYATNFLQDREKLWLEIIYEASNVCLPWLVIGAFNNILSSSDKKGGSAVLFKHIYGFLNCISSSELMELLISSFKYTWRKRGLATKIDKTLCNNKFIDAFHDLIVFGVANPISDHIPVFVKVNNEVGLANKNIPFRFINTWTD